MKTKIRVEFRFSFYGKVTLYIEDKAYNVTGILIHDLFFYKLGKRVKKQYIDDCTIYELTDNQIQIIKNNL